MGRSDKLSGFFNDTRIIGMLEARDYGKADTVLLFMGAIDDRFCGLDVASVTPSDVRYVDVVHSVYRNGRGPGRTPDEIEKPRHMTRTFTKNSLRVFKNYQASELRTWKWHELGPLYDNIEDCALKSTL